ncbi:hypothetical protein pb186bvf_005132 [Paramecium bursaria]
MLQNYSASKLKYFQNLIIKIFNKNKYYSNNQCFKYTLECYPIIERQQKQQINFPYLLIHQLIVPVSNFNYELILIKIFLMKSNTLKPLIYL